MSKKALLGLVMSLETAVRQLTWQSPRKGWVAYSSTHRYPRVSYEEKAQFVQDCLKSNYPSRVWDLGSNTGFFSRLAASMAQYVVSFDNDPACVEENYRQVLANRETNLLPLLMDIANPSAARGWDYVERFSLVERGEVDLVMA
ncbi:MAG: class I SAM-dependent methyltransferase, partial [Candidatus Omnitrophica bacterium]|nr:class I SAM-dependent methyltransferase [Candidatus Omnitrophota bacterium]